MVGVSACRVTLHSSEALCLKVPSHTIDSEDVRGHTNIRTIVLRYVYRGLHNSARLLYPYNRRVKSNCQGKTTKSRRLYHEKF